MENYRKSDQYYEDHYDLATIKMLKKLEAESTVPIKSERREGNGFIIEPQWSSITPFYKEAQSRAKHRDEVIYEWKKYDEHRDLLVRIHKEPDPLNCNTCNARMHLISHIFKNNNTLILFVYDCPRGHSPRKVLYSDGSKYVLPKRKCEKCGGSLNSTTKKTKELIICTDTCTDCGNTIIDEYELGTEKEEAILPEDRKKYCIDFKGKKTLYESLLQVYEVGHRLMEQIDQQEENEKYAVDKIEILKVPVLETRIQNLAESLNFVKFQLSSPDFGRNVTVEFSVQDPTDRTERKSITTFSKAVDEALLNTNWRLINSGNLSCRLGVITGKFKAYESEEDLMTLAKQIYKNNSK